MKGIDGENVTAEVSFTEAPPTVKIVVSGPATRWNGQHAIPQVIVAEGAIRDAAFFLFGRRTGPGYVLSLKPPHVLEDGSIETRVLVIPRGDQDREKLVKALAKAAARATASLEKAGVVLEKTAAQALNGQGV